jgi:hypothetical protein
MNGGGITHRPPAPTLSLERFSRGSTPARTSEDLPHPEAPRIKMKPSALLCRRLLSTPMTRSISSSRPKNTAASISWNGSSPG